MDKVNTRLVAKILTKQAPFRFVAFLPYSFQQKHMSSLKNSMQLSLLISLHEQKNSKNTVLLYPYPQHQRTESTNTYILSIPNALSISSPSKTSHSRLTIISKSQKQLSPLRALHRSSPQKHLKDAP